MEEHLVELGGGVGNRGGAKVQSEFWYQLRKFKGWQIQLTFHMDRRVMVP